MYVSGRPSNIGDTHNCSLLFRGTEYWGCAMLGVTQKRREFCSIDHFGSNPCV